jgi:hypothetical protein
VTILLIAAFAQAADTPGAAMPAWMAGCWEHRSGDKWTEECWTGARAGQMMGSSRSGKGEALQWYEHTRITAEGGAITFCALPKGQAGGCFKATKVTGSEIVFENAAHDFPQRISYAREGNELVAQISDLKGERPQRWRYRRPGN